jgi:hypothetical protein
MISRLVLPFAASALIAMASTAMPAAAADIGVPAAKNVAVKNVTVVNYRVPGAMRHPASRDGDRRQSSMLGSNLECSGVWCGRQFVLILGIGY